MDPLGDYNCHYDGKLTIFVNCLAEGWFDWLDWFDWFCWFCWFDWFSWLDWLDWGRWGQLCIWFECCVLRW